MRVQKWELANKIKKLRSVVPKLTTAPILQNILVENGTLTATNMELTVSTKLQGAEGESMLIPVKAFGLIDQLPNGEVEITKNAGGNRIMIKAGDSIRNAFEIMDPAEFPKGSMYGTDEGWASIDGEDLTRALRNVLYAVSKTAAKPQMCTVCMECSEGTLSFFGLNGQQVAWDKIPYDGDFRLLIPRTAAEQLISTGLEGDVVISYRKLAASFRSDEYTISTRLVDGEYFNVRKMFASEGTGVELIREAFTKAVRRADMCNEDTSPVPVRIDIEGDNMNVYIKSSTAAYQEALPITTDMADKLTIAFNPALLKTTMDSFTDDRVEAFFQSPKHPMIVKSKTSQLKAMLLPVLFR